MGQWWAGISIGLIQHRADVDSVLAYNCVFTCPLFFITVSIYVLIENFNCTVTRISLPICCGEPFPHGLPLPFPVWRSLIAVAANCVIYCRIPGLYSDKTLRWRHNERNSVSNHQPHDCLLNRLFRRRSMKAPRYWPLCGEFTGDRWIPRTKGQ